MSGLARKRRLGSRILKAVASALRLDILILLYERGPLSYSDIMNLLKLNPSRDAGRFAYHLKTLLGMDLIEPDPASKKYFLTEMGKAIVEFTDELDESAYRKKMLVRTSRLAIENFDRNKIVESLVREAEVPIDLAQKIAREAEKRLLKLGIKYVTAPLIREFVNAILVEKGLEEYRHKLTRVGLPIYDVTLLMKEMSGKSVGVEEVHKTAGDRVIEEYTLLNTLPRDIADAHISGALNLNNLGQWVLKINGFMHDLRLFLRRGLVFKGKFSQKVSLNPPKSFRSALLLLADFLRLASKEISSEQGVDYFNIFLAPYIRGLSTEEVKEELFSFLASVNLTVSTDVSLGLETVLPSFLSEQTAYGQGGDESGFYGDYVEESHLLASLVIECLKDRTKAKPIFNPSIIIKLRPETFVESDVERILFDAHALALEGLPYFANLNFKDQLYASYTSNGTRFSADWKGDWEIDTIRTGCIGYVTLNLPRTLYEAEKNKEKFFENLFDISEKGLRALEIKYYTIAKRAQEGLLPFLAEKDERDPYIRVENSTCLLGFVGLNEATRYMTGKAVYEDDDSLKFAEEVASYLAKQVKEYAKKRKIRFALAFTPDLEGAKRLAELDIERYGLGEVHVQGGKDTPYYTNLTIVPKEDDVKLEQRLNIESRFHNLTPGGHLVKIPLEGSDFDVEALLATTKKIVKNFKTGLYTFDRSLTFCSICQKTFRGEHVKCPQCGSVKTVAQFRRAPASYRPKEV